MKSIKRDNRGLTLIELIIVVSILGLLAVIALTFFRGQIFKGHDAKRKSDINRIKIAVEEYEKDHNCYPSPSLVSCIPGTGLRPYIDKIPCDPGTKASYIYYYQPNSCPRWYKFYTVLTNAADSKITPGIGPNNAFNYVSGSSNAPGDTSSQSSPTDPTAPPGPTQGSGFYGCIGGVCVPISWNPDRPGPACDPNYQQSNCLNECALEGTPSCTTVP